MSYLVSQTIFIILGAYLYLWLLQLLFWPIVKKIFATLPDEGWSLARFFGLLAISLILWEGAHLGVPINTNLGILTALLMVFLVGILLIKKQRLTWLLPEKESLKFIFLEEYLFLIGFAGICLARAFLPNLDSLEKFMDYGFIVRYLNSSTLPAMDMWQAGNYINYYSFGHYWASVLIRFLNVAPEIGYNLVLGFVAGQSLSLAFLVSSIIGKGLSRKGSMVGALLGALMVVFGGNSHTVWYILKNRSLSGYWYADATRFIHNTIHEFPGYSLVVSDLHGHLFDLPTALMFLIVFYLFTKRESVWDKIVLGGLFAIMMMTNTWDVPTYGLLMSVWLFWTVVKNPNQIGQWLQKTMLVFGTMMLVSIPWWLKFQPISSGIAFVNLRSPIWQLAVLWSASWLICFLGWMVAKKSEAPVFVRALIITTILLVLIPELVYAKDIYPDHPRANTMFKLTYQACIMTGIIFGATTGKIVEELKKKFSILKATLLFILMLTFGSLMIFPTVSFPSFFENFATLRGLDGELWLKDKSPEKYEVVQYLKQKRDGKNMVEAVGDSYTDLNVVSVYSGVPTVQGWRVHEWLWRGGYESVGVREKQVKEIYEGETITEAKKIMREYSVGWIFVGSDEEDKYLINHPKIRSLGKMVWEMNESYLIKVE